MTRDEFDQVAGPLLVATPFLPVVLHLSDGSRLFVDDPAHLHQPPGSAVEFRTRTSARRLDYDQIARVEPFDRADDGSIRLADFQATLRRLWRDSSQPFEVELTDGRRLGFPAGGGVVFSGRHAVVMPSPGRPMVRFSADQVSRIEMSPVAGHA